MCGAGGLSLGFAQARTPSGEPAFDVRYGVDLDPNCMATYRANVLAGSDADRVRRGPERSVVGLTPGDILEAAGVESVGTIIGGPNCQAVSTAGLRNPEDARNKMFREFHRLVGALRPRWFVMENVPGLAHANALPLLLEVLSALAELDGYEVAADVLLAADYGVAQYRYRLFIIGTRTGVPIRFPAPTRFASAEPRYRSVRDAIASLHTHDDADVIDLVNVRRIKHVPAGGDWRDLPVRLLPERNFWVRSSDQRGAYGRLDWDEPAYTITGLFGNITAGRFTHPTEDRAITATEAARLQGFDADFTLHGKANSWHRQIGNAVPPPLARAVAQAIARAELGASDEHGDLPGRLDVETVKAASEGGKRLPVLTPRLSRRPSTRPTTSVSVASSRRARVRSVDPSTDRGRLEAEARMSGHRWTAKRARAVLGSRAGKDAATLALELRVSERSVTRWIADYEGAGAEGWRAYHTPTDRLVSDPVQRKALREAVRKVRRPAAVGGPRVNRSLRQLIERFGDESVNELIQRLRTHVGVDPGTVYVGDLLAVCSVLLEDGAQDGVKRPSASNRG